MVLLFDQLRQSCDSMEHQKVETRVDFLQYLEADVSVRIMNLLDDPADLVRASAVSRFWHQFVVTNGFAKQLCLKKFPELTNIIGVHTIPSEEMVTRDDDRRDNPMSHETLNQSLVYASLIQALTKSKISLKDCIANVICASSTDNYPEESVVNTLNPRDRFIRRASYWSSKGQSDPEVSETLIYKLRAGIWVITEIDIQPFEAFFQPGKPIYSSKFVRFRMGYPKSSTDIGSDFSQLPLQKAADDKFVWTYTSPEYPMSQRNCLQPFKLPEPVLCIGGYLQIELLGRVQKQEMDGLFYMCVCYVRVLGRPLSPAFDVATLEPHGKLLLKYYPKNLNSILKTSSRDEIPYLRQLEEEMLWERISLIENLLREIQQGPNNPFVWDEDDDDDAVNEGLVL